MFHAAKEKGLKIIPVLNKVFRIPSTTTTRSDKGQIDLPAAEPERIASQIQAMFDLDPADILNVSAKTGVGVREVLHAIIDRVPAPSSDTSAEGPLKMLLFDSLCVVLVKIARSAHHSIVPGMIGTAE